MKRIINLIRKPLFLIILALGATVAISFGAVNYLILPKFQSYQELAEKNATDANHLSLLARNVASFESLDKKEIADYALIVKTFVPEQNDILRFLALNEIVAASSGVKVSGIQAVIKKTQVVPPPTQAPTGGSGGKVQSSAGGGLIGKVYAQASPTPTAVAKETTYSLKVSISGGFESIEAYLDNLKKTDRLLGVANISITSSGESGISALVTLDLALGDANIAVAPEDSVVLTAQDKQFLEELAAKVLFSAQPAKNSLGRPNPFN